MKRKGAGIKAPVTPLSQPPPAPSLGTDGHGRMAGLKPERWGVGGVLVSFPGRWRLQPGTRARGNPACQGFDTPVWIQKTQMDWTGDKWHVWWGGAAKRQGVLKWKRLQRGFSLPIRDRKRGS